MRQLICKFLRDRSGATTVEYCLIAAGIGIVIVVAVNGIGSRLNDKFASVRHVDRQGGMQDALPGLGTQLAGPDRGASGGDRAAPPRT